MIFRNRPLSRLALGLALTILLAGCGRKEQGAGGVFGSDETKLDPVLASVLIDGQFPQRCNQERQKTRFNDPVLGFVRIHADGAQDMETIRAWWRDSVESLPNFVKTRQVDEPEYSFGNTTGYVQLTPGAGESDSPYYTLHWFDNQQTGYRYIDIAGCLFHPTSQILDTTVDPANPKHTTVTFSLDYPRIKNGVQGAIPDFKDQHSSVAITMAQSSRCTGEFNRLDATGWELSAYSCR
jgi:hypothetical protein